MAKILILHGPNLNLLGEREPSLYGKETLENINQQLEKQAAGLGHQLTCIQSNAEHMLLEQIQMAKKQKYDFIIFNPAAFTHTSVALRDAMLAIALPFIEVHLSNIHSRESFRKHSYFSDIALGVISGFGSHSYQLALQAADFYLNKK